mmetsp:Transcript_5247/g.7114  ORF Transcript_5247/g.7114 Transcript_5247/m.7114 type:complete len:293 (+) Transcript_5247:941-1819(+)
MGTLPACTFRISTRPKKSGSPITTFRSNLPGRMRAESSTSGLLVAAMTTMEEESEKPSSSESSWLSVWSRSSLPPPPPPRLRPTASNSSMKIMAGEAFLACAKRSLTRAAPTPTNISTNSEAVMEKKATPDSPATARASRVLPVPGGPARRMPRGMRLPEARNFSGLRKKSTTSMSSTLASPIPATSAKVTRFSDFSSSKSPPLGPLPKIRFFSAAEGSFVASCTLAFTCRNLLDSAKGSTSSSSPSSPESSWAQAASCVSLSFFARATLLFSASSLRSFLRSSQSPFVRDW